MNYKFKYSISNPNGIIHYLFVFLSLFVAIFINYLILKFFNKQILLTLDKIIYSKYEHPVLALCLFFIIPLILLYGVFVPFLAGFMTKIVINKEGSMDIFTNYAILHYKNKEILLEKGQFSIEAIERKNIYLLNKKLTLLRFGKEEIYLYVIKNNDGKNYKLYRQTKWYLKSSYVKCTDDISLSIVMQELYKISNI